MSAPRFIPPKNFRAAEAIQWAEFSAPPTFYDPNLRLKGAAGKGLAYERKVHSHLLSRYSPEHRGPIYVASRWISYGTLDPRDKNKARWAQPDGFIIDFARGLIIIIEVKIRHTQNAWWGLRRVYEPLFRFMLPGWAFAVCEVVNWYDPAINWPEPFTVVKDPALLRANEFGVHICATGHIRDYARAELAAFPSFPLGLPNARY